MHKSSLYSTVYPTDFLKNGKDETLSLESGKA